MRMLIKWVLNLIRIRKFFLNSNSQRVFILDGLCVSPRYDCYLYQALKKFIDVTLCSITFHLEPNFFKKWGIDIDPGLFDIVSKLKIQNKSLRQALKGIEYCINLSIFLIRFYLNPPYIVHVQWLPLITKVPFERWFIKALQWYGIKTVYTVHNILPHDIQLSHNLKKKFESLYKIFDALICHTTHAKEELIRGFNISEDKIWVIPHGPFFHDTPSCGYKKARSILGINLEPMVLYLGSIRPYKGIEFLLNSWKRVTALCPEATLWLVGKGDQKYIKTIYKIIEQLEITISVKTEFRYVSDEELIMFHTAADILVCPYKEITQSGALLTGMAFGKAIVATKVGGFKETIIHGKTGLLVEYDDTQSLAEALIYLIKHPEERDLLGKNARLYVNTNFSWDIIAKKTIECYTTLKKHKG